MKVFIHVKTKHFRECGGIVVEHQTPNREISTGGTELGP